MFLSKGQSSSALTVLFKDNSQPSSYKLRALTTELPLTTKLLNHSLASSWCVTLIRTLFDLYKRRSTSLVCHAEHYQQSHISLGTLLYTRTKTLVLSPYSAKKKKSLSENIKIYEYQCYNKTCMLKAFQK